MCESLLIHPVSFYDTSGKRVLKTSKKYYSVDHGLKNALGDFKITDRGFLLENIVYNELIARNYKVNTGKMRYGEIDFVAIKESEIIYIQVANTLNTEKIKKREYGNLMAIKDNYKKMVITEDRVNFINDKGVLTINVID
jgi:predicted AAA+ superfamily ATPase